MREKSKDKYNRKLKVIYWVLVFTIFISLIFMVCFVLNSSKIYVDKSTIINPYVIEWTFEGDGSLRINEPYYLKANTRLIDEDWDRVSKDSSLSSLLSSDPGFKGEFSQLTPPYLIWKNAGSDTIHILKNNVSLNFLMNQN